MLAHKQHVLRINVMDILHLKAFARGEWVSGAVKSRLGKLGLIVYSSYRSYLTDEGRAKAAEGMR